MDRWKHIAGVCDVDVWGFGALEARYRCSGGELLRHAVREFGSAGGMEEFLGGAV